MTKKTIISPKKTKIVMTIGPASDDPVIVQKLIDAGVNVVRCNFSHGEHAEHQRRMETVRAAAEKIGKHVAILQDLCGPKIRIGDFVGGQITLTKGQIFTLSTKKCEGTKEVCYVNYAKLPQEVIVGQPILLDDGSKKLVVTATTDTTVETRVEVGGMIRSRRGVNIPGAHLSISALTAKDRRDVAFGVAMGVDFVALSFVRSPEDVRALRRLLKRLGSSAKIIAKIETEEAVADLDEIIHVSDGIMVARGDLAVEVPAENVPHIQKDLIARCNVVGRPVIVATQMLESMINAPVPTRAEVADVTNAILDGTDAIMLSAETAVGLYPVEAVRMMHAIACRTERDRHFHVVVDQVEHRQRTVNAVAQSVVRTAEDIDAVAIVALTESGFTAGKVARYRPHQPIIALSPHMHVCRQILLLSGCYSYEISGPVTDFASAEKAARAAMRAAGIGHVGDRIVLVAGMPFGRPGTTNMLFVITL